MAGLLDKQLALANAGILAGGNPSDLNALMTPQAQSAFGVPQYVDPIYSSAQIPMGAEFDTPLSDYDQWVANYQQRQAAGTLNEPARNAAANLWDALTGYPEEFNAMQEAEKERLLNKPPLLNPAENSIYKDSFITKLVEEGPEAAAENLTASLNQGLNIEEPPKDPLQDIIPQQHYKKINKDMTPYEAKSTAEQNAGTAAMMQAGATDTELSAWDKLNEEFDMTTVGLALLATNDGSANVGQNIGKAMMMGRQEKERQRDKKASSSAAARQEALDERKVRAQEVTALAAMERALAKANTPDEIELVDNKASLEVAQAWLQDQGVRKDAAGAKSQEFITDTLKLMKTRSDLDMATAQRLMFEVYKQNNLFEKTSWHERGDYK